MDGAWAKYLDNTIYYNVVIIIYVQAGVIIALKVIRVILTGAVISADLGDSSK